MTAAWWLALALATQARFSVSTEAVQVDVFVGRNGKAVLGLDKEDFEIWDDGVPQNIELVSIEEVPLSIAIVLDTSQSVKGAPLADLRRAAHRFLNSLGDDDEAAVILFSHFVSRPRPLSPITPELHRSLDTIDAYGATAWHDALYAGLKTVEASPHRPMVLLFTDGEDTYSWLREEQLRSVVEQSHAVLYAVGRDDPFQFQVGRSHLARERAWRRARQDHARRIRLQRELAEATGGRLIQAASTDRLEGIFLEIFAEMKTRYLLTYRPSGPIRDGWHAIEVKVNAPGADVHARRGYFYESR